MSRAESDRHPPGDSGDSLAARLIARIDRDGPLRIDAFMAACLEDPCHGYWHKGGGGVGADGDFITAPEISQVFGELIGLWCVVVWQSLGRPDGVHLIELGPGRGSLMVDALRAAGTVAGFLEAASLHLIEASEPLREVQRRALLPARRLAQSDGSADGPAIAWHASLDGVPQGPAIVIANEFLDALPIRQLIFAERAWRERVVASEGEALIFALGAGVDDARPPAGDPTPGTVWEVREGDAALVADLARRTGPLVALFIDYGPAQDAFGDTLQAVRRHAYVDPLAAPGASDLSAHVQFAALKRSAAAAGLAADGPIPQAAFLGRLGIGERASRLMAANPARAGEIAAGVERLMSPTGMGGLFKAMTIRSWHLPPLAGFL
jgi:NADH dehydrogenase [ubiquinone] 1 alpha subcomplex assembly factor 7